VTVRLAASVELPPSPVSIAAELKWVRGRGETSPASADWSDPRNHAWDRLRFGRDRTITIVVNEPGVYEVALSLFLEGAVAGGYTVVDVKDGPAFVTVTDSEPAAIQIDIDAEALKAAIAEAKKQ